MGSTITKTLITVMMVFAISSAFAEEDTASESSKDEAGVSEPKKPVAQKAKKATATPDKRFRFGLFVMYNSAKTIQEKGNDTYLGVNYSFQGEETTTGAPGIGISLENRLSPEMGVDFGIGYEFARKIKSFSGTIAGVDTSSDYTGAIPEVTVKYLFVNGRYYPADRFFVLGGLNYSDVDVKNSDVNLKGLVGWQFGGGYEITPNISTELQYKTIRAKGDASTDLGGNQLKITYDEFKLSGLTLLVRYTF
jgi:hypothetical protein